MKKNKDTKKQFAQVPLVSPSDNSLIQEAQETKPSLPLKSAFPRKQLGDSGTRMLHGIITEEYNPQLQGIEGIRVYDEMRKSDGTVRAALLVCTLPIQRASWFVNPASDDPKDIEVANFVRHALFDWTDMTWDDIVRQALLMETFGVMLFEKVYGTREHEGQQYVVIKKLAPRLPKSILMWELQDGTFGIQQIRQDGILAQIPGSKLLVFVNEREGDNWWGTSMIRSAYHHWYNKQLFYKIDAIAFERQGLGVPIMTMPEGYTPEDEKIATKALKNLRANESGFLIIPPGYTAEFMSMGATTTRDPEKSINHHNKEILQSVLAQFLELGVTGAVTGSRALAQDHSDLFLKAIESIANTFISEINKNLIPELVDLNFSDINNYPVLDYSGITKTDIASLGTAFSELVKVGALTPTSEDEQFLRSVMGMPPRTLEEEETLTDGDATMEQIKERGNIQQTGPEEKDIQDAVEDAKEQQDQKAGGKKKASEPQPFKSWRPLTFAETKVEFGKIQSTMDAMEADFSKEAQAQLNKTRDTFMARIHEAIRNNDQKAITELEMQFRTAYAEILRSAMKKAYTYGKNTAASEMKITPPANTTTTIGNINAMADTIAQKTVSDITTKARVSALNAIKQNTSVLQAVGAIDLSLQTAITKAVANTAGIIIGQNINSGRNDVFQRNVGMIRSLQRSEVLDRRTCDFCLSMDGLVVSPDSSYAATESFHTNCRGIWVEIMTNEKNAPAITGIPSSISSLYGGQPNELIQPKRPIVREGTPAAEYVKKREALKRK